MNVIRKSSKLTFIVICATFLMVKLLKSNKYLSFFDVANLQVPFRKRYTQEVQMHYLTIGHKMSIIIWLMCFYPGEFMITIQRENP